LGHLQRRKHRARGELGHTSIRTKYGDDKALKREENFLYREETLPAGLHLGKSKNSIVRAAEE